MEWVLLAVFVLLPPAVFLAAGTADARRRLNGYRANINADVDGALSFGIGAGMAFGWIICCLVIAALAWSGS